MAVTRAMQGLLPGKIERLATLVTEPQLAVPSGSERSCATSLMDTRQTSVEECGGCVGVPSRLSVSLAGYPIPAYLTRTTSAYLLPHRRGISPARCESEPTHD